MSSKFKLVETTVDEIHEALEAGEVTSEELVERYIERIEAYDNSGPELNSVVTVNENAAERAAELDEKREANGFVGPLHGIPVLVKDQAETEGVATTFGSEACADYVPDSDATIVSRIKEAGAVVLAKTNLPDWACAYFTFSSASGQTKNPYDLERDPGGSSGGTGASVAANLGVVGIGEDTGGSIRVPSANCNLYGIRPTTGLVSRTGLSPIVPRQDTAGPMARTVTDMTYLLDVLVGYDAEDAWSGITAQSEVSSYTDYLNEDGLESKRIGVLRDLFGNDDNPNAAPVNEVVENAIETLSEAGAEIVDPVSVSNIEEQITETEVYDYFGSIYLNDFIAERDNIPYEDAQDILEEGVYHEDLGLFEAIASVTEDPEDMLDFWRSTLGQETFRRDVLDTFAANDLDALVFPDVQVVPPLVSDLGEKYTTADFPANTPLGAQTQCPAVSVPGELTKDRLPVGVELLGKPHHEHELVEIAYAYEQVADTRKSPEVTPPLSSK
jgi:amidase